MISLKRYTESFISRNMIHLKSWEEIKAMQEGGAILRKTVETLIPWIKAGITTEDVDNEAARLIKENGGDISFNKVPGYSWATCLCVNEQIVHTPPNKYKLKDGDVLTVDIGVFHKGMHTDYADTIVIGGEDKTDEATRKFLKVGREALDRAIEHARVGGYIGEISHSIEQDIYGNGYHILSELTGHGVGKDLHEAPYVPGYLDRPIEKTYKIKSGLVIAVEVIYSVGTEDIAHEKGDDWSIVTSDGSLSACFEKTIALFDKKRFILT